MTAMGKVSFAAAILFFFLFIATPFVTNAYGEDIANQMCFRGSNGGVPYRYASCIYRNGNVEEVRNAQGVVIDRFICMLGKPCADNFVRGGCVAAGVCQGVRCDATGTGQWGRCEQTEIPAGGGDATGGAESGSGDTGSAGEQPDTSSEYNLSDAMNRVIYGNEEGLGGICSDGTCNHSAPLSNDLQRYVNQMTDHWRDFGTPFENPTLEAELNQNFDNLRQLDLRPSAEIPDWALTRGDLEMRYNPQLETAFGPLRYSPPPQGIFGGSGSTGFNSGPLFQSPPPGALGAIQRATNAAAVGAQRVGQAVTNFVNEQILGRTPTVPQENVPNLRDLAQQPDVTIGGNTGVDLTAAFQQGTLLTSENSNATFGGRLIDLADLPTLDGTVVSNSNPWSPDIPSSVTVNADGELMSAPASPTFAGFASEIDPANCRTCLGYGTYDPSGNPIVTIFGPKEWNNLVVQAAVDAGMSGPFDFLPTPENNLANNPFAFYNEDGRQALLNVAAGPGGEAQGLRDSIAGNQDLIRQLENYRTELQAQGTFSANDAQLFDRDIATFEREITADQARLAALTDPTPGLDAMAEANLARLENARDPKLSFDGTAVHEVGGQPFRETPAGDDKRSWFQRNVTDVMRDGFNNLQGLLSGPAQQAGESVADGIVRTATVGMCDSGGCFENRGSLQPSPQGAVPEITIPTTVGNPNDTVSTVATGEIPRTFGEGHNARLEAVDYVLGDPSRGYSVVTDNRGTPWALQRGNGEVIPIISQQGSQLMSDFGCDDNCYGRAVAEARFAVTSESNVATNGSVNNAGAVPDPISGATGKEGAESPPPGDPPPRRDTRADPPPIVTRDGLLTGTLSKAGAGLGSFNSVNTLMGLSMLLQGLATLNQPKPSVPAQPRPPIVLAPSPTSPQQPGTPTVPQQPSVALSASPNSIPVGGTSKLVWTSFRANECALRSANGSLIFQGAASGTRMTDALQSTTAFSIRCSGDIGARSATTTVYVGQPAPVSATLSGQLLRTTQSSQSTSGGFTQFGGSNWCDPARPVNEFVACLEGLR
ncbi:MAG: hypothetical protein WA021_00125 [Minisyncoccia bacterium]